MQCSLDLRCAVLCSGFAGEFPIEDSKRLCTCMLDTALSKLPPGGEQILGVIDLRDMSLSNVDLEFVAFMVEAFFIYYPRRSVRAACACSCPGDVRAHADSHVGGSNSCAALFACTCSGLSEWH